MDTYETPVIEDREPANEELSHSDKMIGVFTEPGNTFLETAKFPPRTIDWLLPLVILLLLVSITQVMLLNNEEIFFQVKEKQRAEMEKMFSEMTSKGQLTEEQAEQQMDAFEERFAQSRQPGGILLTVVSIFIIGFLVFFIVAGIYFLFSRFVLKGDGTYKSAMVAYGLSSYIVVVQIILVAIASLMLGRMLGDLSVGSLLEADKSVFSGFLLYKLDIFSIWVYIVIGIGLAGMFRSFAKGKFIAMVFGIWLVWSFLTYFIAKSVPFLSFLNR